MHLPSHPQYNDIHTWTKYTHNYNANPVPHLQKLQVLAISTTIKPQPQLSTGRQFASGIKFIENTRNEKNISKNQNIKMLSLKSKWNCFLQRYNYPWKAFGSSRTICTNHTRSQLTFCAASAVANSTCPKPLNLPSASVCRRTSTTSPHGLKRFSLNNF